MNPLEHSPENFENKEEKRPRGLIILLSLSAANILSSLWTSIRSYIAGPLSEEKLDEGLQNLYESVATLKSQGAGETLIQMIEQVINYSIYVNENTFYLNAVLLIITFLVGAVSLFFLFSLKKIGFHLYVLYSFLPVMVMYIVAPSALIPNLNIVFYMIVAGMFALLYAKHLRIMK